MQAFRQLPIVIAFVALLAAGAGAHASSGGVGPGGGTIESPTPGCPDTQLGRRTLRLGDCGGDVATLNWILRAKEYGNPGLVDEFEPATRSSVQEFQRDAGLRATGVFRAETASSLVNAMPPQLATWYGPGFFGNTTACGQRLTRRTQGVAHRKLPCGTRVVIAYGGRFVRTTVIDRGPFANGAKWDLAQATARALRFSYTDEVRVAKIAAR